MHICHCDSAVNKTNSSSYFIMLLIYYYVYLSAINVQPLHPYVVSTLTVHYITDENAISTNILAHHSQELMQFLIHNSVNTRMKAECS